MKLIVDTNVLFSFFKRDSFTRSLILSHSLNLSSPELSLKELSKYSEELLVKSKLTKTELDSVFSELRKSVNFVSIEEYSGLLGKALKLGEKLTKKESEEFSDDLDFFALSLKENTPIWSNDALFKKIPGIKVFKTSDLVKHLKSSRHMDLEKLRKLKRAKEIVSRSKFTKEDADFFSEKARKA